MVLETAPQEPAPPRERGWRLILLALALFLLVPAIAPLRLLLPVEQTILLVGPAIAVCALVSWMHGGRAWLAVTWLGLSAWMLLQPLTGAGPFEYLARGWAIVLVTMFGIVCAVAGRRLVLSRALSAVAATFIFASAVLIVTDVSPLRVQRTLADELDRRAAPFNAQFQATGQTAAWQDLMSDEQFAELMEQVSAVWSSLPDLTLTLYPALLGLESLAALTIAWGLFHRISRTRVGPPMGRLRDFRFGDQLIWGIAAGSVLVLLPSLRALQGLGYNLLFFFGTLYLLRGLGVITWFLSTRFMVVSVLILLLLAFLYAPMVQLIKLATILALTLGVGDTWIDWRGRARQPT